MIYVRIEIWPRGDRARARCLQEGLIYNVGGDANVGEYDYKLSKAGGFKAKDRELRTAEVKNVLQEGHVGGFPRRRLYAHDLLFRVLRKAFGDRNHE